MKKWTVVLIFGLAAIGRAALAAEPEPAKPDAEALIRQLSDDRWAVREEATRKLTAMGPAAIPALRRAMGSDDLEVSTRARMIYKWIVGFPSSRQLQEAREQMHKAFADADYPRTIDLGKRITASDGANVLDWLWLGHGAQLAGRWKEAVDAYRQVIPLIDEELATEVKLPQGGRRRIGRGKGVAVEQIGPPGQATRPLTEIQRRKLVSQRTNLATWIARMQTAELKDPRAAAGTLGEALKVLDAAKVRINFDEPLALMRDLAAAQHDSGDLQAAFRTWAALRKAGYEVEHGPVLWHLDIERMGRALAQLPQGRPLPEIQPIVVLTPEQSGVKLMLDQPKSRQRAYRQGAYCHYAFAPPPGKEFATLEFACDIEQLEQRWGGQFTCYITVKGGSFTRKQLADIGWPRGKKLGREIIRGKADVPPGVELVYIRAGSSKGHFNVHTVEAKATFRPVTKDPPPVQVAGRVQTELLPKGGTLTCGNRTLGDQTACDLPPGKYVLRYEVPGRTDKFETGFVVEPGRRYGIFVNLDSPFRWTQAGPAGLYYQTYGRASISRLPDGTYLAIWCAEPSKIMLSRTKDLVRWTPPEAAAFNSIFENIAPAAIAAADGTVWVAFLSRRLSLRGSGSAGYRMFLTGTRDGRTWTPLRPVALGTDASSGMGGIHMLRAPDGRHWIFWRDRAAAAKSIADIRELSPIHMASADDQRSSAYVYNPHVTVDGKGLFHMVFDSVKEGAHESPRVCHSTSRDGTTWSAPTVILEGFPPGNSAMPQLILAGGKAAVIYESRGAYLTPIRFDGPPVKAGRGVKIVGGPMGLHGSRATLTKKGEVLLLAGQDTSWLLRAKLKDLLAIKPQP